MDFYAEDNRVWKLHCAYVKISDEQGMLPISHG